MRRMRASWTIVACFLAFDAIGCQGGGLPAARQEATFGRQWTLYQRCRAERALERLVSIAERMKDLARETVAEAGEPPPWLREVIQPLPIRRSADPVVLAAACLTRAQEVAAQLGPSAARERLLAFE